MRQTGWGPLAGIRVLDVTRILSGPFGGMILADLGADVVHLEQPGVGDETRTYPPFYPAGESHYFVSVNRNKRSIAVDLRTAEGQDILRRLARAADVLLENFRPGTMARWGLDWPALSAENPRLVYCSVSGFGQTGPLRDKVSFDIVTQAMSGAMSVTGEPGAPMRSGIPMGDLIGGLYGAIGILSALMERERTGRGQYIDLALHDGMLTLLGYLAGRYFLTGESPGAMGSHHLSLVPYGVYRCRDGHLVIAILVESFWPKLCAAMGVPELADDPRFRTNQDRLAHRAEVTEALEAVLMQRTVAEWTERFEAANIPFAPILSVGEALEHPQTVARGMVETVDHPTAGRMRTVGRALKFSAHEPAPPVAPAPLLGQHTAEVLAEWAGVPASAVEDWHRRGVVYDRSTAERTRRP
jgi:crotonobetainyl-CoA:carnitine CoA-transferase CaiB-like acyl-CoA transferase